MQPESGFVDGNAEVEHSVVEVVNSVNLAAWHGSFQHPYERLYLVVVQPVVPPLHIDVAYAALAMADMYGACNRLQFIAQPNDTNCMMDIHNHPCADGERTGV